MKEAMLRVGFALLAVLFLIAGLLQVNDPAPGLWIAIYTVAALGMAAAVLKRPAPSWVNLSFAVACTALAAYKGYLVSTGAITPMFEETPPEDLGLIGSKEGREMLGLVIVAAAAYGIEVARRFSTALDH